MGKWGINSVFESGKLVLTQNGYFIDKCYSSERMVKLCIIEDDSNKNNSFAYLIDSINLWHRRFVHTGISTIKRMVKSRLVSSEIDYLEKCKTYIKSTMIKK